MDDTVIAVDPGREKCGIAVVRRPNNVISKKIIGTSELKCCITQLVTQFPAAQIVLGDRTSSKTAKATLEEIVCDGKYLEIILVDEHRSTDDARKRYWIENPPSGLKRLIPLTLQVPPVPVDDYVAVILAGRYFSSQKKM